MDWTQMTHDFLYFIILPLINMSQAYINVDAYFLEPQIKGTHDYLILTQAHVGLVGTLQGVPTPPTFCAGIQSSASK